MAIDPKPPLNSVIPVTRPFLPPLEKFLPYLEQIWESGILTNGGPLHQQLEAELVQVLGLDEIALFNNGTIALVTALQALDLKGEVITTPYSFVATAHAITWNSLTPVFVDIDPASFNIDPALIEAAITDRTTAILAVHCYGNPCDTDAIEAIAKKHGLRVIYDAAHAFGVRYKGKSLLGYGDLSAISFHATKVFNTFEGGAVICKDKAAKDRITHLRNFGILDETSVEAAGLNGKLSEIHAAMGLLQLRHLPDALETRRTIDARYREGLRGVPGLACLAYHPDSEPNHSYFPVLVGADYGLSRDGLYQKLKDAAIHARRYFYPLISNMAVYRALPSAATDNLPVANRIADQVLCLPVYPGLAPEDQNRIIDILRD